VLIHHFTSESGEREVVNGRGSSLRVTRCFYCTSPLEQLLAEAVKVVNAKNAQTVLDKMPE
jgi:uncharacterized protein with PIN domain